MSVQPQPRYLGRTKRRIRYRLADEPTTGIVFGADSCGALSPGASPPGTTVQFTDKGAQTLTNAHVVLIFWGREWANGQLANLVINAVRGLLAGPYMSYLAQYGVRRASIWGTKFVTNGDPPNPFAYSDIGNFVINQLDADNLPEPDSDWPIVYAVFLPSNVSFQGDPRVDPPGTVVSSVLGANSSIIWNDYDLGDVDNDPAYYLWVGNGGNAPTQANVDYITTLFSHELVERCTDPNGGNGIVKVGGGSATSQIGDPCFSWCDNVRGVKAQSYWVHNLGDPLNGQCVLPKLYSVRRTLAERDIGGQLLSITLQSPIPSLNSLITSRF